MKNFFFIPVCLLWSALAGAQQDSVYRLVKTLKTDIVDFTVDNLGNIYLFNSSDQLKKINAGGDSVAVFNQVRKYGKVSSIDVSNPLRVLLYYKDFATLVVLDRLLNIRNTIDLRRQGIFQVQAVGLSYDNKIWLYDEVDNRLKKMDEDGRILFETPDFRQLFDRTPVPSAVYDQDGFIYLYDTLTGVFIFDYYGALKNKIPLIGWKNFKVSGKNLFGIKNDSLFRYQTPLMREEGTPLPAGFRLAASVNFTATGVYALRKNELEIYSLR